MKYELIYQGEFIEDFRTYLEQKIADQEQGQQQENKISIVDSNNNSEIEWIEQLILITNYRI